MPPKKLLKQTIINAIINLGFSFSLFSFFLLGSAWSWSIHNTSFWLFIIIKQKNKNLKKIVRFNCFFTYTLQKLPNFFPLIYYNLKDYNKIIKIMSYNNLIILLIIL